MADHYTLRAGPGGAWELWGGLTEVRAGYHVGDLVDTYAHEDEAEAREECDDLNDQLSAHLGAWLLSGQRRPPTMSRESRAMLLNVLWHHQGGSSPVGQPLRTLLGIDQHAHLTAEQLREAKWIDHLLARTVAHGVGGTAK